MAVFFKPYLCLGLNGLAHVVSVYQFQGAEIAIAVEKRFIQDT